MGSGSGVAESCGVCCRRGSDPGLLWLGRRLVAVAPILSLAWQSPYAARVALKIKNRKKGVQHVLKDVSGVQALESSVQHETEDDRETNTFYPKYV